MDETTAGLIVEVESLKMQVRFLKEALLNIQGFYIDPEDSTGNVIRYANPVPTTVEPAPATAAA